MAEPFCAVKAARGFRVSGAEAYFRRFSPSLKSGSYHIQLNQLERKLNMKRTIAALALATVAGLALATASDPYRTNAGESEQGNVVKQQLGDASGYRTNAGESESGNVVKTQLG